MRNRLLSTLLALCMVLALLPGTVHAADVAEFDLSKGYIDIEEKDGVIVFTQYTESSFSSDKTETPVPGGRALITQSTSVTEYSIEVRSGEVFLTIEDLNIAPIWWSPIGLRAGAELTLELVGDNTVRGVGSNTSDTCPAAGIAVPENAVLRILGEGSLTAYGGMGGAGIGGGNVYYADNAVKRNCGVIIIESGTVTAYGSDEDYGGAGIGGAGAYYARNSTENNSGRGGIVIINGGNVTAVGGKAFRGSGGAGIGGGGLNIGSYYGNGYGGITIITGGTVNAEGVGAGIGGGRGEDLDGGNGGYVTIIGGEVSAVGGAYSAGIGGGGSTYGSGDGGTVIITGGDVTAIGGYKAFDIGGGGGDFKGDGCERITILDTAHVEYNTIDGSFVDKYESVVSFDANGGCGTMPSETVSDGLFYTLLENEFTPPEGKVFQSWSINGETYEPGEWYFITEDTAIEAIWEDAPKTLCSVTFDANGGLGTMPADSAPTGEAYVLPPNGFTAPEGSQFRIWSVNGAQYAPGDACVLTEDIVVTAVWENVTAISASPVVSINASINNYYGVWPSRYASIVNSYLLENDKGTLTRVEYISDTGIVVEEYSVSPGTAGDLNYQLLSAQVLPCELDYFGGFYNGDDAYYLVFGSPNPEEDGNHEAVRIVEYSKDWERMAQGSVYGSDIYIPFDAGSLRMTELNGFLYIHTCHEMYALAGVHHQKNITIIVDESTLQTSVTTTAWVSHSFNQMICTDGTYIYTVDHGDASPRAVWVQRFLVDSDGGLSRVWLENGYKNVFPILYGSSGDNTTALAVGGFALSAENCLVAGVSSDVNRTDVTQQTGQYNVFLTVTDRELSDTNTIWLTEYTGNEAEDEQVTPRNPQLVKLDGDRFLVIWEERADSTEDAWVEMRIVDGNGEVIASASKVNCRLSDCQPFVAHDGLVKWYVTEGIYSTWRGESSSHVEDFLFSIYSVDPNNLKSGGETRVYGSLTYYNGGNSVSVMKCDPSAQIVDIPGNIDGFPVTEIMDGAFQDCSRLTKVVIPESLKSIGDNAFRNCSSLSEVIIRRNIQRVGEYAFSGCVSLTDIPSGITITTLPSGIFKGCIGLTDITIPDGVVRIDSDAFTDCTNLKRVIIPDGVMHLKGFENCSSLTQILLPESVSHIGLFAFYRCSNLSYITIPAETTYIGVGAFGSCRNLTDVFYFGDEAAFDKAREFDNSYDYYLNRASIHYNAGPVCAAVSSADTASVVLLDQKGLLSNCTTVFQAVYDSNGKLVRICTGQLGDSTVQFESTVDKNGVLFFLDAQFRPICPKVILNS